MIKGYIKILEEGKFVEKMIAAKELKKIAEKDPESLIPYYADLVEILKNPDVKVSWATMFLLSPMAIYRPHMAYEHLGLFAALADGTSVISRDHYVRILTVLAVHEEYKDACLTLLIDEVMKAPVNQLPSYATSAVSVADHTHKARLEKVIASRLPDTIDYPPKTKKLQQALRKLSQQK
ncbi:MAG: hypothetical protein KL787_06290 [Taibaiella sp.]|nr:hypothetical protein [Taibaiella sp.]